MASDSPSIGAALSRSTLGVIVPGLVALAPWILILLQYTDATLGFKDYPTVAHAFLFAAVAVVGSLCNDLGTAIESTIFDPAAKEKYQVEEDWFSYLAYTGKEPVGFRYLGRLYTTLSFELSMVIAAPLFAVGSAFFSYLKFPALGGFSYGLLGAALAIIMASVFFREGRLTHEAMCRTRHELMIRLRSQGVAPSSPNGG